MTICNNCHEEAKHCKCKVNRILITICDKCHHEVYYCSCKHNESNEKSWINNYRNK